MTRIIDAEFTQSWVTKYSYSFKAKLLAFIHFLVGFLAFLLVIIQSISSGNLIIFVIWLVITIILILSDKINELKVSIKGNSTFMLLTIIGTIFSLPLATVNSLFFIEKLGRIKLIIYQVIIGSLIALRLIISLFYEFSFGSGVSFLKAKNQLTKDQFLRYKETLLKTEFEFSEQENFTFSYYFVEFIRNLIVPTAIVSVVIVIGVAYALLIYFIIPPDALKEFLVGPALIIIALLYSILLLTLNSFIVKESNKTKTVSTKDSSLKSEEKKSENQGY